MKNPSSVKVHMLLDSLLPVWINLGHSQRLQLEIKNSAWSVIENKTCSNYFASANIHSFCGTVELYVL